MSRHARLAFVPFVGWIAGVLMLVARMAGAQTIADYSSAQRAWLESTMSQAAARSAGLTASAAAAASLPGGRASAPARRLAMPAPTPAVQVSGVFASGAGAVAEVTVNATAYVLGVGQGVPGTAWQVETIGVDKVVLSRPGAGAADSQGVRKAFSLPALR